MYDDFGPSIFERLEDAYRRSDITPQKRRIFPPSPPDKEMNKVPRYYLPGADSHMARHRTQLLARKRYHRRRSQQKFEL